jgi:hypothetical protein
MENKNRNGYVQVLFEKRKQIRFDFVESQNDYLSEFPHHYLDVPPKKKDEVVVYAYFIWVNEKIGMKRKFHVVVGDGDTWDYRVQMHQGKSLCLHKGEFKLM